MSQKSPLQEEEVFFDNEYKNVEPSLLDPKQFLQQDTQSILEGGKNQRYQCIQKAYELLGNIQNSVILDYGCGYGKMAVFLALSGAREVYGFDISNAGIKLGKALAELNGVGDRVFFDKMSATDLYKYRDGMFDVVIGEEVLHHIKKYPGFEQELQRILRQGGKAIFFSEPFGHNLLIEFFRKLIIIKKKRSTSGDRTLTYEDINRIGQYFSQTNMFYFSLLFQAKRFFVGKFHKGPVRAVLKACYKLDKILLQHFPFMKKWCGEIVVEFIK
ncbi:MAG: class I SAM-dependent methyltransferase [Thermodesulfobacteriota bacterium]|jgi:2-polyprenyl-3-methyl-5-hydroxy-6-metoxy-1,4-benzoquinol methylase